MAHALCNSRERIVLCETGTGNAYVDLLMWTQWMILTSWNLPAPGTLGRFCRRQFRCLVHNLSTEEHMPFKSGGTSSIVLSFLCSTTGIHRQRLNHLDGCTMQLLFWLTMGCHCRKSILSTDVTVKGLKSRFWTTHANSFYATWNCTWHVWVSNDATAPRWLSIWMSL